MCYSAQIQSAYTKYLRETGAEMDKVLAVEMVDLVILDLKLPDEDGLAIARRLRESLDLPIIILTGRKEEVDRVMGLELGADDYVTKPFSQRELLARIKAVLRRTEGKRATRRGETVRAYRFSGWELNTGTRKLRYEAGCPLRGDSMGCSTKAGSHSPIACVDPATDSGRR